MDTLITRAVEFSIALEHRPSKGKATSDLPGGEPPDRGRTEKWEDGAVKSEIQAYHAGQSVRTHNLRLELRLGPSHPVVVQHEQLRVALSEWEQKLRDHLKVLIDETNPEEDGLPDDHG